MDMAEEFQGGGTAWWNPAPRSLLSGVGSGGGGVGGFSSPCSVAQLGGGGGGGGSYDMMSNLCWPNEVVIKGKPNNHDNSVCDNNLLVFPSDMDSSLDVLGFGISPTSSITDWNQQNLLCNGTNNDGNFDSILQEDVSSGINYGMTTNSPNMINSNTNFSSSKYNSGCNNPNASPPPPPPMAALTTTTTITTASSNSSGDSSTITCEGGGGSGGGSGGGLNTSFPMSSSTSYLIQSLFDDIVDDPDQLLLNQNYGAHNTMSPSDQLVSLNCSWLKPSTPPPVLSSPPSLQLEQNSMFINGGRALSNNNVRASLLNSLQSRSRAPTLINHKPHNSCANNLGTKVNNNEEAHDSKRNICDQPPVKRARIETPSPMPTFKVRKEKLGDRITALQQLVSPFGKTDTASVLHEAIEYIKFLHDQVNVLSTPYLKNGASIQQQQQQQQEGSDTMKGNEESNKYDLRNRGLCLVPISSTYPVAQETPVDFWTPTFGGTIFR